MAASSSKAPVGSRIRALDGLRAIAVILVFVHHVDQVAFPGGGLGVTLFFVLSGFLITTIICSEIRETREFNFRRFYWRRFLRLSPALIVMVAVVAPLATILRIGKLPGFDALFALTYLTDFWQAFLHHLNALAHTWSLSVEEQFYLVWPLALLFAMRRGWSLAWVLSALVAASTAITVVLGTIRPTDVYTLPTTHAPALAAGALLAVASFVPAVNWLVRWISGQWLAAAGLAMLVVALFYLHDIPVYGGYLLTPFVCMVIVAHLVTHRKSPLSRALAVRPLTWLGERSYGFYLWHYPILLIVALVVADPWARAGIALALTMALTITSWLLVETPFLRLKDRGRGHAVADHDAAAIEEAVRTVEPQAALAAPVGESALGEPGSSEDSRTLSSPAKDVKSNCGSE